MNYKNYIIYFIYDINLEVHAYYFKGILSKFFCKLHFRYLTKKYPNKIFYLEEINIFDLLEDYII